MTASVPNRHSPMAEVKNSVSNMGSFVVDQNFLQNQTIKGMSSQQGWIQICEFDVHVWLTVLLHS
jgi:hypothetical protein